MSKTGVLLKDGGFGTAERCEEISQGYAFFAYPWYRDAPRIAPRQGCEESATPFQGADSRVVKVFQGYAKNAYPWLISQHRSAVPNVQTLGPRSDVLQRSTVAARRLEKKTDDQSNH